MTQSLDDSILAEFQLSSAIRYSFATFWQTILSLGGTPSILQQAQPQDKLRAARPTGLLAMTALDRWFLVKGTSALSFHLARALPL